MAWPIFGIIPFEWMDLNCKCYLFERDWDCPCNDIYAIKILNVWQQHFAMHCEYCSECMWKPLSIPPFYHLKHTRYKIENEKKYLFEYFDTDKYLKYIISKIY